MAKSPKKTPKVKLDLNQLAARIVAEATGQAPKTPEPAAGKSPQAIERGRKGGLIGGDARAAKLTPARRKAIASKAAKTRWKKDN